MVLGPVLLPRLLDSAERISPEVQQEDLSLGPHSALSSAGIWNPGLLGPLFLVYLCPYALLWGPWPLACVSISLPSRVQRQIWVGQLLPWHRWDLAPYSHQRLVLILRAQQKALCAVSRGCLPPASWRGQEFDGKPNRPGAWSVGRTGQEEQEVSSLPH